MRNLITDVTGFAVGQAHDDDLASGVTAVVFDEPATAIGRCARRRARARGRPTSSPRSGPLTVSTLSSCLAARPSASPPASGAMARLAEAGRGYAVGHRRVPIVPGAILFDLLNGGDKAWGRFAPYRELGYQAAAAAGADFALGTAGAGFGATAAHLKGGIGSASAASASLRLAPSSPSTRAGSVTVGEGPHFWAAPFEVGDEYRRPRRGSNRCAPMLQLRLSGRPGENTTHRRGRDGCPADEGAGSPARRHGAGRACRAHPSRSHALRRRHGLRCLDRPAGSRARPVCGSRPARCGCRLRDRSRGRPRGLRSHCPALSPCAAELARPVRPLHA